MENCSFCKTEIKPGTGKMYVKKDGKIFYFCTRRCEKHLLKYKRNPRHQKWVNKKKKAKK